MITRHGRRSSSRHSISAVMDGSQAAGTGAWSHAERDDLRPHYALRSATDDARICRRQVVRRIDPRWCSVCANWPSCPVEQASDYCRLRLVVGCQGTGVGHRKSFNTKRGSRSDQWEQADERGMLNGFGGLVDASTVSAGIAAVSAAISAVSAWNARRSALASESALKEASRQRTIDNARQSLGDLGRVYDDAMALIESLARDLQRDPVRVQRCRDALSRSIFVAGENTSSLQRLVRANGPLRSEEIDQVKQDLQEISQSLHAKAISSASTEVMAIGTQLASQK